MKFTFSNQAEGQGLQQYSEVFQDIYFKFTKPVHCITADWGVVFQYIKL